MGILALPHFSIIKDKIRELKVVSKWIVANVVLLSVLHSRHTAADFYTCLNVIQIKSTTSTIFIFQIVYYGTRRKLD